jgi:hypothetical protein
MDFKGIPGAVVTALIASGIVSLLSITQPRVRALLIRAWYSFKANPMPTVNLAAMVFCTAIIVGVVLHTRPSDAESESLQLSQSSHQAFESQKSIQGVRVVPPREFADLIIDSRQMPDGRTITFEPDEYLKDGAKRVVPGAGRNNSSALELSFQARCPAVWLGDETPNQATVNRIKEHANCTPMKEFIRAGITDGSSLLDAVKKLQSDKLLRNGQTGEVDLGVDFNGRDRLITLWVKYVADHDDGPPLVVHVYSRNSSSIRREIRDEWVRIHLAPGQAETNFRLAFWFDKEPVKGGGKLLVDDLSVWQD